LGQDFIVPEEQYIQIWTRTRREQKQKKRTDGPAGRRGRRGRGVIEEPVPIGRCWRKRWIKNAEGGADNQPDRGEGEEGRGRRGGGISSRRFSLPWLALKLKEFLEMLLSVLKLGM